MWRAALEWVESASSSRGGEKSEAKKIAAQRAQRMAIATGRCGEIRLRAEIGCAPCRSGEGTDFGAGSEAEDVCVVIRLACCFRAVSRIPAKVIQRAQLIG